MQRLPARRKQRPAPPGPPSFGRVNSRSAEIRATGTVKAKFFGGVALQDAQGLVTGPAAGENALAVLTVVASGDLAEVSRHKVVGLLWPEKDEKSARHLLSEVVYVLRKELGRGSVLSIGQGLAVDPEVLEVDVRTFLRALEAGRMEEAVRSYRGPFLDGFHLKDSAEFEQWVDQRRRTFELRYVQALEALADDAASRDEPLEESHWLRKAVATRPLSARMVVRLMEGLARAGDRAEAIQAARDHEWFVRESMEMPPEASVTELRIELESAGWTPGPPKPPREAPPPDPDPPPANGPPGESPRAPPEESADLPSGPADSEVASRHPGSEGARERPGVGAFRLLLGLALVAGVAGIYLAGRPAALRPMIVVPPFYTCCESGLENQAERAGVVLADTLADLPGLKPVASEAVLAQWWERPPASPSVADMSSFARRFRVPYYASGCLLHTDTPPVTMYVSVREVRGGALLLAVRGEATNDDLPRRLDELLGELAVGLRASAAERITRGSWFEPVPSEALRQEPWDLACTP